MIFSMNTNNTNNALNFKIVGTTIEPVNPIENTIWVNTEKMTNWSFNVSEPENPTDGDVWFCVGTVSPISFNVLKKNNIVIYPIYAQQYSLDKWCDVNVKIYQNNGWVDFPNKVLYLLKDGNQYIDITGGWSGIDADLPVLTGSVHLPEEQVGVGGKLETITGKKIDFTDYNLLSITVDYIANSLTVFLINDSNTNVATKVFNDINTSTPIDVTMDISNISSECYLKFVIDGYYDGGYAGANYSISEIKLKK